MIQILDVDRAVQQSRGQMAQIAKKTKRDPSDLTDEEWEQFAPLMPKPGRRGRPREVDFREVVNTVRYLVRSGCGWRMLPIHFGGCQTVYGWFHELARRFLFQTIHDVALIAGFGKVRTGFPVISGQVGVHPLPNDCDVRTGRQR